MALSQPRSRWFVLLVIWLVFVLHGVDRSIITVLLNPIAFEFGLSDSEIGLVAGLAYALPFALAGIPIGALADRVRRVRLLSALVALWSVLTALAGFAPNYSTLLAARASVGASEAGAPPTMLSILGDTFDDKTRPAALSIYYTAPYVGLIVGSSAAGALAQYHGWRTALQMIGLPGVILAVIVLLMVREPERGATSDAPTLPAVGIAVALRQALGNAVLVRLVLALVLGGFATLAIANFFPLFLQRTYHLSQASAGFFTAVAIGMAGGAGVVAGGLVSSRICKGDRYRLRMFCATVLIMACMLAIVAPLMTSANLSIALFALWSFLGSAYIGAGWGLAIAACPAHIRGTVLGAALVIANLIGAGLGPQFVGSTSDLLARLDDSDHLRHAMAAAGVFALASGMLFLVTDARSQRRTGELVGR